MNAPFASAAMTVPAAPYQIRPSADLSLDIAVLVLPGFSHLALHAYIEPFRMANALSGKPLFRWRIAGLGDEAVLGANGIAVSVDVSTDALSAAHRGDFRLGQLAVISGEAVEAQLTPRLRRFLRAISRRGIPVLAMGTATWLLAEAGLLANTRCTIHWSRLSAFSEVFSGSRIRDALFVRDGQYFTCAGELAAFDLAVNIIGSHAGSYIAQEVCRHATVEGQRPGSSRQTGPSGLAFTGVSEKLVIAIRAMEEHVESPLTMGDVAKLAGVSRRQLERLFISHIGVPPVRHYLKIRLDHARRLIEGTRMPIIDIAMACGFVSASHFAKCFKAVHGISPQHCRRVVPTWIGPGLGCDQALNLSKTFQ